LPPETPPPGPEEPPAPPPWPPPAGRAGRGDDPEEPSAEPPEPPPALASARGIVFDLDGTLIDSRRDITTAINGMRAERGLPPLSVAEVRTMVGEGARVLVRRALPPGTGKDDLKQALASYLARYAEVCLDTTRPYPGVLPMLAAVAQSFFLAVLSNKGEALSRRILQGLGLDRYLREVVGGDSLPTRKPNPGGLFLLADRMGIPAGQLLLVGDSPIDAATARAAGCAFALAMWGEGATAGDEAEAGETVAGETASPGWRLARPADLLRPLGLAEEDEEGDDAESR
jgi:phosphoglycolate phosphatase